MFCRGPGVHARGELTGGERGAPGGFEGSFARGRCVPPVEEDTLLTLAGVGAVGLVVVGLSVAGLAAITADDRGDGAPDAEWSFERVNDSHVRVAHAGGDPVEPAELIVSVDGYRQNIAWDGAVTEGDGATLRVSDGQVLRVYWVGTDQRVRTQLAQWRA